MDIRNVENNWHWGKLTVYEKPSDGSDGCPVGAQRFDWSGWSLRIGWHQVALWHSGSQPIIEWLTPWSDRLYTHLKGLYICGRAIFTHKDRPEIIAAHKV